MPQVIAGFSVLTATQILIGFHHHFDGLIDFSDAVMVRGEPSKRLEVMHDKSTGAVAVAARYILMRKRKK